MLHIHTHKTHVTRERKKSFRINTFRLADKKAQNKLQVIKKKRTSGVKLTIQELELIYEYPEKIIEKQNSRLIKKMLCT